MAKTKVLDKLLELQKSEALSLVGPAVPCTPAPTLAWSPAIWAEAFAQSLPVDMGQSFKEWLSTQRVVEPEVAAGSVRVERYDIGLDGDMHMQGLARSLPANTPGNLPRPWWRLGRSPRNCRKTRWPH